MLKMILSRKSWKWLVMAAVMLSVTLTSSLLLAQDTRVVQGVVQDEKKTPVPGTTVVVKGTQVNTSTGNDGRFFIRVPADKHILVFTYIGKLPQEVNIQQQSNITVTLKDNVVGLEDVVIVGYGRQKRESVVAAVSQTDGKTLERAGGVSNIGAALTGNVPGLITAQSTGLPGEEDPQLIIRGLSTWNNSNPLILVDGVERPMSSVDIGSVETVTVLKDASATAVFGSRGANGVILITTKRGKLGKASIRATVNNVVKAPSKLPGKADSYDALRTVNEAIEYELALRPEGWNNYYPQAILNKYRFPANLEEAERYPNVDWAKTLFKDYATSQLSLIHI